MGVVSVLAQSTPSCTLLHSSPPASPHHLGLRVLPTPGDTGQGLATSAPLCLKQVMMYKIFLKKFYLTLINVCMTEHMFLNSEYCMEHVLGLLASVQWAHPTYLFHLDEIPDD